jgi:lipopolysaccharide assembly protein A
MRFVKVIISTVIVLLGVVFIVENLSVLNEAKNFVLNLYFFNFQTPDIPLWVIILFTFFLGVFTTCLYGFYEHYQQRQTIRQLRHNMELLAKELKPASATAPASAKAPELQSTPQSE